MNSPANPSTANPFERSGWVEDVERIDQTGDVYVRLQNGRRSLKLQVSPVGKHRQTLARSRFGDVSYTEVTGLSEPAAAKMARAYAAFLQHPACPLPRRLPHLAVAAARNRKPGDCRATLSELWPADLNRPAPCDELRLDPAGLTEFLAPELRTDSVPFAGFVLRSVRTATAKDGSHECILELEPALSTQTREPVLIAVGTAWVEGESFGARQQVGFAVRRGGVDSNGDLLPDVARLCSLLAALIELKQSPQFTVDVPDLTPAAPATVSASNTEESGGEQDSSPAIDTDIHRFAILSSGYTVLRQILSPEEVARIADGVDRALAAMRAAAEAGRDIAYTFYDKDTYLGTRCIYCWGDACVRLVENDFIRRISDAVIGQHKLFDMSAHRALPAGRFDSERTEDWHRDIDVFDDSPPSVRYLWFFVPLDDFTEENGATWVVPGSQRLPNTAVPSKGTGSERFPTRIQLTGRPGDVFVINPSAVHSVGHNATERPRTMINLGVCHATIRPLLDHWSIAGPAIQAGASERLRLMLGAIGERPLDTTWSVLPEGWKTSKRSMENDPSAHVFPEEQQGYQRSHRIRNES